MRTAIAPTAIDLREWIGLAAAARETGYTSQTIRLKGDAGKIRMIRDPAGRRLVHRQDVLQLAEERSRRLGGASRKHAGVSS